jgi:hypothetical protein
MSSLKNLAAKNGNLKKVKPWHVDLEKVLPSGVIYHLFLCAEKHGDHISFPDQEKLDAAMKFEKEVRRVFANSRLTTPAAVFRFVR